MSAVTATEIVRELESIRFYGSLEIKFEDGRVVLLKKTETIKPDDERQRVFPLAFIVRLDGLGFLEQDHPPVFKLDFERSVEANALQLPDYFCRSHRRHSTLSPSL